MRFHDFHLDRYEVSDRGKTIALDLAFGYPGKVTDYSRIQFTGVALYNFVHTQNAIITDIREITLPELLAEYGDQVTEWDRMCGLQHRFTDLDDYLAKLNADSCRAWYIESAIGFYGFVVAQAAEGS